MSALVLSSASCNGKGKAMKAIEGKDGLFAILTTEKGSIALKLFYDKTPMTVANFVGLAEGTLTAAGGKPFYDGLKFHRVIEKFMIQGGDPRGNGTGGPGYNFPDEFVEDLVFDKEGKLAMANAGPDTNGSQFFITHTHTEWLNNKHTIFGEVVEGQDVVDAVKQGDTIQSIKIIRNGADAEKFVVTQEFFDELVAKNKDEKVARTIAELEKAIEGCEKTDNGIYFKILEEGKGNPCGKDAKVTVEYKGYLTNGTMFDASSGFFAGGHEALEFTTDSHQMIEGFDLMVQDMKVGETRKMVLPPEFAYGPQGYPGVIPPNAYICFDVQVVSIN